MKQLTLMLIICAVANAVSVVDYVDEDWDLFKRQFNKTYDNAIEENFRQKIFMDNQYRIMQHNKRYKRGEVSFTMKINQFGDMLAHEVRETMTGYRNPSKTTKGRIEYLSAFNASVPNSIDWRQLGAVTEVKNQRQCGSCWAFSATGALEGQYFRRTGRLVSLSEQNLIDCTRAYGNLGCKGGWQDVAYTYIANNKGINSEPTYPYEGVDGQCRYRWNQAAATDMGSLLLPPRDDTSLLNAVASVGPIAVSIDVQDDFMHYSSGVYSSNKCGTERLNHAVLVVGYSTTANGQDYWLVKNSWGATWGEQGYIRMSRNVYNNCGISTRPVFPKV